MVDRFQKKGKFGYPKPSWVADYGSVWWSRKASAETASLNDLATMVLETLDSSSALFIGAYKSRSSSTVKTFAALSDSLATARGVSFASEFGRPPEAKFSSGFSLLIGGEPRKDLEVPALGFTFGDIQSASMLADFEQAKEFGNEACAILLREPENVNLLLMAIAQQAEVVSLPSSREGVSVTEAEN